jgi:ComF family protein
MLLTPIKMITDFALPPRCPGCSAIVTNPHAFCESCWQKLHFLSGPACAACDLPVPFENLEEPLCAACLAKPPEHAGIKAAVVYSDIARQVVLRLKYGGRIGLATIIANALRRYLADMPDNSLIAPVPLHWTRLWARSFNQSALIAAELQKGTDLQYIPDVLIRKRRTPLLRGLSAKERGHVVKNAFALNPKSIERIKGRHLILVDDVYTTGATCDACVKMLKKNGAASVTIFCWARVLPVGLATETSVYLT